MKPELIVGVGASAGGLESLERFFSDVPLDSGMAFVVVQHLSPDYRSLMDELLARHTSLQIVKAEEDMPVEANCIYLMPPKKEMIISDGNLHLTDKDPKGGLSLPIDHFFRSLAQDVGKNAVGIILSGTGSDGSRGIKYIHGSGGLVLVESDVSAKFTGMPDSAMQTGFAHQQLDVSTMPDFLVDYLSNRLEVDKLNLESVTVEGIDAVFALLQRDYQLDFSHYKPATVTRRIGRRLSLTGATNLQDYVEKLANDNSELNSLYCDLLIGVTEFFRDIEPFEFLEEHIVPKIMQSRDFNDEIRIWVAGCATGEEAYSLSILFNEAFEKLEIPSRLKIFATDVHRVSLDQASQGIFERDRLQHVSEERLERYFVKKDNKYQVKAELRQPIVFAKHNLIKDAPFTNLDLITCRNLLIYFKPPAQQKTLSMFHFGLKTGRFMMLGGSESPGELSEEFEIIHDHCKVYSKRRDLRLNPDYRMSVSAQQLRSAEPTPHKVTTYLDEMGPLYDSLLSRFMPTALLVNQERELLECYAGAEKLLRIQGRRPTRDLLDLLESDAKSSIAGALARVMQHGKPVKFKGIKLRTDDQEQLFELEIQRVQGKHTSKNYYLIILHPLESPQPRPEATEINIDDASSGIVNALEEELRYSKENLQETIEELETSNEEMQATNEELVASNEELQSTNEELHSVNEELYTVNTEHQLKIKELAEVNSDIENLLRCTDVAVMFLDSDMRIRRYTPQICELFDLLPSDVGRRINSFTHQIILADLTENLQGVLSSGKSYQKEVQNSNGDSYFMRILPYIQEGSIEGVVLTFIEINVLVEARQSMSHLSSIVNHSKDAIISFDLDGRIQSWNKGSEDLYQYTAREAIGRKYYELIIPQEDINQTKSWFQKAASGTPVDVVETERHTKSGDLVHVSLTLSPMLDECGNVVGVCKISQDLSPRRRLEQMFRRTFEATPAGMIMINLHGKIMLANKNASSMFGYAEREMNQLMVEELIPEDLRERHIEYRKEFNKNPRPYEMGLGRNLFGVRKDGSEFPCQVGLNHVESENGTMILATVVDITKWKQTTAALEDEIQRRERFIAILSHELRNPLGAVQTASLLISSEDSHEIWQDAAQVIERQSRHMTRLLDDLLEVSRITQDRISLHKQIIDIRKVVENAYETISPRAKEKSIVIEREFGVNPIECYVDPTRIEQVVVNLVANAIKYSDEKAEIHVSVNEVIGYAIITVSDNGVGIEEHMLERIFELFTQVDATLDHAEGGMGVGLTLAKKLVEMHGGSIQVESRGLGCGSRFEVRIPRGTDVERRYLTRTVETAEQNGRNHSAQNGNGKPNEVQKPLKNVFIIDDMSDNRDMLKSFLELEGLTVRDAPDGETGIELIDQECPDAVIVDIGLPGMDGYEVAQRLKSKWDSKIMLIALTGYGQGNDVEKAYASGFDLHLTKPLKPEVLLAALGVDSVHSK